MKTKILMIFLFTLISGCLLAQKRVLLSDPQEIHNLYGAKAPQYELYYDKVQSYTSMKNGGSALIVIGIVTSTAGGFLIANGSNYLNVDDLEFDAKAYSNYVAGCVLLPVGITSLTVGVILASVGNRKLNYYLRKIDGLNVYSNISTKQIGLTLTYNF